MQRAECGPHANFPSALAELSAIPPHMSSVRSWPDPVVCPNSQVGRLNRRLTTLRGQRHFLEAARLSEARATLVEERGHSRHENGDAWWRRRFALCFQPAGVQGSRWVSPAACGGSLMASALNSPLVAIDPAWAAPFGMMIRSPGPTSRCSLPSQNVPLPAMTY